jgi:hypothetical protein
MGLLKQLWHHVTFLILTVYCMTLEREVWKTLSSIFSLLQATLAQLAVMKKSTHKKFNILEKKKNCKNVFLQKNIIFAKK